MNMSKQALSLFPVESNSQSNVSQKLAFRASRRSRRIDSLTLDISSYLLVAPWTADTAPRSCIPSFANW